MITTPTADTTETLQMDNGMKYLANLTLEDKLALETS